VVEHKTKEDSSMRDIRDIKGFHFHVYYSNDSREKARELFNYFGSNAHWYDKPIGPHTQPMFVVEETPSHMEDVYKFMILNRGDLSVLIHPITKNELEDHTTSVGWLGKPVPLDLDWL